MQKPKFVDLVSASWRKAGRRDAKQLNPSNKHFMCVNIQLSIAKHYCFVLDQSICDVLLCFPHDLEYTSQKWDKGNL